MIENERNWRDINQIVRHKSRQTWNISSKGNDFYIFEFWISEKILIAEFPSIQTHRVFKIIKRSVSSTEITIPASSFSLNDYKISTLPPTLPTHTIVLRIIRVLFVTNELNYYSFNFNLIRLIPVACNKEDRSEWMVQLVELLWTPIHFETNRNRSVL